MSLMQKISHLRAAVKQNGGIIGSVLNLYRTDELKFGDLIGTDKYGNRYYQNKMYFIGRSRWVDFADSVGMDYDGSQIPAEWHMWLSYVTDHTPDTRPPVQRDWMIDHEQNLSGTRDQYVPYSTTKPKIESWQPPKVQK